MQVLLAIPALFQKALISEKLYGTTALSELYTVISAGYFWMDTFITARNFNEHGLDPLLHAVICIVFFTYTHCTRRMHYFGAPCLCPVCCVPPRAADPSCGIPPETDSTPSSQQ